MSQKTKLTTKHGFLWITRKALVFSAAFLLLCTLALRIVQAWAPGPALKAPTEGENVDLPSSGSSVWTTVADGIEYGAGTVRIKNGKNLEVSGTVQAGSFLYSSDARLKQEVKPIENALEKILRLTGVHFEWQATDRPDLGLIAQDVEKVFPELVQTDASGLKSVEYGNLVAPLIEAIKIQQQQLTALRQEIEILKAKQ